jgi:hypothetical protein
MIDSVVTRAREAMGPAGRPCGLCGGEQVLLMRSWDAPSVLERALERFRARPDRQERWTDECRDCGGRAPVRPATAVPQARIPEQGRTPGAR